MPTAPSSSVMRTMGVSWLTKDWIASTRFTFGTRSTINTSTCSIFAMLRLLALGRAVRLCHRPGPGVLHGVDAAHDRLAGGVVAVVVVDLADDPEVVDDEDAVGDGDHLRHVA